jgi:signal transduction histidine kinase
MKLKRLWSGNKRFRLLLTLELAVMLPAAALVYVNYNHLNSIKRDKSVEAAIHRDFREMLAISDKKINQKAYTMAEEVRPLFPSPDTAAESERVMRLDRILATHTWLTHVFLFDGEKNYQFRSRPEQMNDPYYRAEHERLKYMFRGWFSVDGRALLDGMHKRNRHITGHSDVVKRAGGYTPLVTVFFPLPNLPQHRVVLGGVCFDPLYVKEEFFPEVFEELIARKQTDQGGNQLAMLVYSADLDKGHDAKPIAASSGWTDGKPEVTHSLSDIFRGLAFGIKYQGTSAEAIGRRFVQQSFLILGVLTLLMVGGLMLTYRSVNKEVALARLKSDFVSNVSHELRTPLALIRLYAETLELGRINTQEKKDEYYRIIRKESERLTALINNILDFSRIEAGRKEYEFRETDIAELVRNTLDAYRYQIEQHGFAFEQSIDSSLPPVHVDREAIARALVNLVNNALKYSADEKFLGVKLFRAKDVLKLEVIDRGIGIPRREQSRIFEKFYRTGDPLVHNTKGSGLGLSLVRHITRAHGGEVEVESTPGKGSKFTLSLPLTAPNRSPGDASAGITAS